MDSYKIIIAGSREYNDYYHLEAACNFLLRNVSGYSGIEIVSGAARGADTLGERYAHDYGLGLSRFPADWQQHGNAAGPIRNREMAEYADALIAFPIGQSTGTRNMIKQARQHGLCVKYANPQSPALKGMEQWKGMPLCEGDFKTMKQWADSDFTDSLPLSPFTELTA